LLNVGPTARGVFDHRAEDRLKSMGEWMKYNGKSVYGCTQAPPEWKAPDNTLLTYNPITKKLYLHLLSYPLDALVLSGYKGKIKYAQFLHDNSEVKFNTLRPNEFSASKGETNDIVLRLPVQKPNTEIPVIELTLQ
jgi:hypothetical protein